MITLTGAAEWSLRWGAHEIFLTFGGAQIVFSWDSAGRKRCYLLFFSKLGGLKPPQPPASAAYEPWGNYGITDNRSDKSWSYSSDPSINAIQNWKERISKSITYTCFDPACIKRLSSYRVRFVRGDWGKIISIGRYRFTLMKRMIRHYILFLAFFLSRRLICSKYEIDRWLHTIIKSNLACQPLIDALPAPYFLVYNWSSTDTKEEDENETVGMVTDTYTWNEESEYQQRVFDVFAFRQIKSCSSNELGLKNDSIVAAHRLQLILLTHLTAIAHGFYGFLTKKTFAKINFIFIFTTVVRRSVWHRDARRVRHTFISFDVL